MSFQFLTKCCEWRGRLDVDRKTVPESRAGSSKRTIADCSKSRRTDVKETAGRRAQPASMPLWKVGLQLGLPCVTKPYPRLSDWHWVTKPVGEVQQSLLLLCSHTSDSYTVLQHRLGHHMHVQHRKWESPLTNNLNVMYQWLCLGLVENSLVFWFRTMNAFDSVVKRAARNRITDTSKSDRHLAAWNLGYS